jgi:hypothetical protein
MMLNWAYLADCWSPSDSFSFCLLFPEQKNGNGKEIKGNIGRIE